MGGLEALEILSSPRAVAVTAAIVSSAIILLRFRTRRLPETHKRGVLLRERARERQRRWRSHPPSHEDLTIAGTRIAFVDESKHFKLIGTTGTGKSTAIRELMDQALWRGDRAVFADPDGGYAARFFDRYRGDVLLNPFERGSVKWDLFAEISNPFDAEQIASALIPGSNDAAAAEWRGYARTLLTAVIRRCRVDSRIGCSELWRLLAAATVEELRPIVAGTPAQPFLEPDNARMFGSIRSVLVAAMAAFEHVQAQRAAPFCVRRWVRSGSSPGALFIPYRAGQVAALKAMIATWMRLAIFEAMNGAEDHDQRLWFVIDELDALGAIDGLKDALTRLRKFGGRCVLGFQSAAQVSSTYGAGDAQTIIENCGNTLVLRCSGSENGGTSQFASRLIGDREVLRRQVSYGRDREAGIFTRGTRRSRNTSEQHIIEPAVLPSQLEQLPDLCGYWKGASSCTWLRVRITPPRPSRARRG
jgi:type IV secretory pathway TraG/TraD family ATPase VirD4